MNSFPSLGMQHPQPGSRINSMRRPRPPLPPYPFTLPSTFLPFFLLSTTTSCVTIVTNACWALHLIQPTNKTFSCFPPTPSYTNFNIRPFYKSHLQWMYSLSTAPHPLKSSQIYLVFNVKVSHTCQWTLLPPPPPLPPLFAHLLPGFQHPSPAITIVTLAQYSPAVANNGVRITIMKVSASCSAKVGRVSQEKHKISAWLGFLL